MTFILSAPLCWQATVINRVQRRERGREKEVGVASQSTALRMV
jgi:hypothetical protein